MNDTGVTKTITSNRMLRLNLDEAGYRVVVPEYGEIVLKKLFARGRKPIGSAKLWTEALEELQTQGKTVSRASVIFLLNWLVKLGVLGYEKTTGKGGYRRLYYAKMTEQEFWIWLMDKADSVLRTASGLHNH